MKEIKKLLVAIDEGPIAEKVAQGGLQLGLQLNAAIALVSIVDISSLMIEGSAIPTDLVKIKKKEYMKIHQMLIEKIFKDHQVRTFIEEGKPYEAILKVAEVWEADLIVLGTHGRTGLTHLIMGSVAEKLIRHSEIPTLIIPTRS
jgi:nucleotide-binding universal stress UspA family protein